MIEVFEHLGKWLVASNVRQPERGIAGSRSRDAERDRLTFEQAWDGEKWIGTAATALKFETSGEARVYIDLNAEQLEQTLVVQRGY